MVKIQVQCPACKKKGDIEVSENSLKNISRGLIAVNIPENTICSHTFVAYVDKNLQVRDYFKADFKVDLPELPKSKELEDKVLAKDIVNLDLVKLNIPATLLVYVLKSIFNKSKIVIISDESFLYEHIHDFFNYITRNSFKTDISLISKAEYEDNKKNYKEYMVFKGIQIVNNYKNLINPKKLKVETQIIQNFLSEQDLAYSYIALRNEIHKAYQLSEEMANIFNEMIKKKETPNILKINNQVEQTYGIKINTVYLNSLISICKDYFGAVIPSISNGFLEL